MKVPAVGESITEVTIAEWIKKDGDTVEMDEVIAEIESDKATFELTAEAAGTLRTVAQEGDSLEIGALVCKIEVCEGSSDAPDSPDESQEKRKDRYYFVKIIFYQRTGNLRNGPRLPRGSQNFG